VLNAKHKQRLAVWLLYSRTVNDVYTVGLSLPGGSHSSPHYFVVKHQFMTAGMLYVTTLIPPGSECNPTTRTTPFSSPRWGCTS
jgi:hypothetical protein